MHHNITSYYVIHKHMHNNITSYYVIHTCIITLHLITLCYYWSTICVSFSLHYKPLIPPISAHSRTPQLPRNGKVRSLSNRIMRTLESCPWPCPWKGGTRHGDELLHRLERSTVLRRKKEETCTHLPPNITPSLYYLVSNYCISPPPYFVRCPSL